MVNPFTCWVNHATGRILGCENAIFPPSMNCHPSRDYSLLAQKIKQWAVVLGFQEARITNTQLGSAEQQLSEWLAQGLHGKMAYMAEHSQMRSQPQELIPGTLRIISVRMNYLADVGADPMEILANPNSAYISRYALGRDYHKLIRSRLTKLANHIRDEIGDFDSRAFVDTAPVMEKPIAAQAGHGWIGKHCIVVNRDAGSFFFFGELFTNLPLPVDDAVDDHCGSCRRCIDLCPTQAIIAPYKLDARRCISYLTNTLRDSIPVELRPLIGNRIFGCDDCQLVCPWNQHAAKSCEPDFMPRQGLDSAQLADLFAWTEEEFLNRMAGSAIRRIGHHCWLKNIAVALGNAATSNEVVAALQSRADHESELVREHVAWGLRQHSS